MSKVTPTFLVDNFAFQQQQKKTRFKMKVCHFVLIFLTLGTAPSTSSEIIECPDLPKVCYARTFFSSNPCNFTHVTEQCACLGTCTSDARPGGESCQTLQCWKTESGQSFWMKVLLYTVYTMTGSITATLFFKRRLLIERIRDMWQSISHRTERQTLENDGESDPLSPYLD